MTKSWIDSVNFTRVIPTQMSFDEETDSAMKGSFWVWTEGSKSWINIQNRITERNNDSHSNIDYHKASESSTQVLQQIF
jgi:hypothetical protein